MPFLGFLFMLGMMSLGRLAAGRASSGSEAGSCTACAKAALLGNPGPPLAGSGRVGASGWGGGAAAKAAPGGRARVVNSPQRLLFDW